MMCERCTKLPIEALGDSRLTLRDLKVLGALYAHKNPKSDAIWPRRETISHLTGLRMDKVSTATTRLEKLGWLFKTGDGGRSKACRYRLKIPDNLSQNYNLSTGYPQTYPQADPKLSENYKNYNNLSSTKTLPDLGQNPTRSGEGFQAKTLPDLGRGKEVYLKDQPPYRFPLSRLVTTNICEDSVKIETINESAFDEFINYRQEMKFKKLQPRSQEKLRAWLAAQGDLETQQWIVDEAIRRGWRGLHWVTNGAKVQNNHSKNHHSSSPELDRIKANARTAKLELAEERRQQQAARAQPQGTAHSDDSAMAENVIDIWGDRVGTTVR